MRGQLPGSHRGADAAGGHAIDAGGFLDAERTAINAFN